jgi:hypothetical protein
VRLAQARLIHSIQVRRARRTAAPRALALRIAWPQSYVISSEGEQIMKPSLTLPHLALTASLVLGSACAPADTWRTEAVDPEQSPVRACALLTEREWAEVLGPPEAEPSEENLRVTSVIPNRFKSSCLYAGQEGWATIFVERPYATRVESPEALTNLLREYQLKPADRRDSRLYPELQGKIIEPYHGLGLPAATLTPQPDTDMQSAIMLVRHTGITTGVRVEADTIETARLIADKALGRLP